MKNLRKKAAIFFSSTMLVAVATVFTVQNVNASADKTCWYNSKDGCSTGGTTQCTSCGAVVIIGDAL